MKKIGLIAGASFLAGAIFFALSFGFLQKTVNNQPVLSPVVARAEALRRRRAAAPAASSPSSARSSRRWSR